MTSLFSSKRYTLRSKFSRFFGGAYTLSGDQGRALGFAHMKRFRLKEDIRLYADAEYRQPLLSIRTQGIFDFFGVYDVDDATGQRIGTLKRAGLRSTFVRDHWQMLDLDGGEHAELVEDSMIKSVLRRISSSCRISTGSTICCRSVTTSTARIRDWRTISNISIR